MKGEWECKKCGGKASSEPIYSCPHCGAGGDRKEKRSRKRIAGLGCIVFLLIIFGPCIYIGTCYDVDKDAWRDNPESTLSKRRARRYGKKVVKENLRSPSTAKFPESPKVRYQGDRYQWDHNYRIDGKVDAENTFGAKIRSRFFISLEQTGSDRWKVRYLRIGQNLIIDDLEY